MSADNTLVLLGNVGSEETIRSFQNDEGKTTVVSFSLAVTEYRYNSETKQNEKMTDWHNAKAYGYVAGRIEQFVQKGQRLLLTGRLYKETYKKDGEDRQAYGIEIEDFTLVSGGSDRKDKPVSPPADYEENEFPF